MKPRTRTVVDIALVVGGVTHASRRVKIGEAAETADFFLPLDIKKKGHHQIPIQVRAQAYIEEIPFEQCSSSFWIVATEHRCEREQGHENRHVAQVPLIGDEAYTVQWGESDHDDDDHSDDE
jgi:hypothetical protein